MEQTGPGAHHRDGRFRHHDRDALARAEGRRSRLDDLTEEQVAALRGEKGDTGDAFEYSDFTPEQLEALRGPAGADGADGINPEIFFVSYPEDEGIKIQIWDYRHAEARVIRHGTSCTHSWDGTVLTVTSASGTSSADLAGPKGDKGDPATRSSIRLAPAG
ncbi:MAG: hypothetical protein ACLR3C_01960 [Eggerthella lenta]